MPARHIYLLVPARHCACSAHLPRCLLGTAPPCEVLQDVRPTYGSLTGKKQGGTLGLNHMQNRAKKRASCSTCHAKKQAVPRVMQKNKLFHMSCKNRAKPCKKQAVPHVAKTMQKPCKMARTERQPRRTLTVPRVLAIRAICAIWVSQGKPLNIHSPRVPCYMCYMCYMGLTRQATEHPLSPGSLLYVLYVLHGPI